MARHRVRARLAEVSDAPSPDEIAPYREALAVYEWEVLDVIDGAPDGGRLRVAHWAVLGGASQPIAALRPGAERELEIELLSDNPQTEGVVLADDLALQADRPVFLDVGA